eukprot:1159078-Rhodomonas_salina.2
MADLIVDGLCQCRTSQSERAARKGVCLRGLIMGVSKRGPPCALSIMICAARPSSFWVTRGSETENSRGEKRSECAAKSRTTQHPA